MKGWLMQFISFRDGGSDNLGERPHSSVFCVLSVQRVSLSLCTKFHQNRAINGRLRAFHCFSRWRRRPSLNMALHFRFCVFWTQHVYFSLCTKFHQNRAINGRLRTFHCFSRWRRRPSWKLAPHFRFCFFRTQHVVFSLSAKFHRNRAINVELTH